MNKRVLFVDDEMGIRITLAAILTDKGFDVSAQPPYRKRCSSLRASNSTYCLLISTLDNQAMALRS